MKKIVTSYGRGILTVLFGMGVFMFWYAIHPEVLCYQEQNQLFLWSLDYFCHDLSVAGGLADWMSELIVQFYYIPWLGALLLGIFFTTFLWVTWKMLRSFQDKRWGKSLFGIAILITVYLLMKMGDIELLLSYLVALLGAFAMVVIRGERKEKRKERYDLLLELIIIPLLFWLLGGIATWLYVALRCIFLLSRKQKVWWSLLAIPYLLGVQLVAYNTLLQQYPLKSVLTGINYYRVPIRFPNTNWGYDKELCELLRYNHLLRNEDWQGIIQQAEKHQVKVAFASNAINLALGETRQLADRMFDFYQTGDDALLVPHQGNNMSMYPTMEAFWHLGLVNACLRYASDLQESILNMRKSGRLTKRIVECQIVNGQYKQAQKNLDLLKQSTFYRSWALEKEQLLGYETAIDHDPILGKVRRLRFKDDFLFSYGEKDKMLGLLFINNPDNKLALDYFMGEMLLKGNLQGFMQYMPWVQQYGGYSAMPHGYQDAVKCIQNQGNVPGSPYANYAKRMMKESRE